MNIRQLVKDDAEDYLDLMLKLDRESQYMLFEIGERKTTVAQMEERIEELEDSGGLLLGAFDSKQIVGFVSMDRGFANRIKHSGYVVMGVIKSASGKGLGTRLLEALDVYAKALNVSKLELTVMAHNDRAHNLYLRCGYKDEGIKKRSICIDGQYFDEYYMGKII